MYLCSLAERFGQDPRDVAGWPASMMRLFEADALMRKAQRAIAERAAKHGQ